MAVKITIDKVRLSKIAKLIETPIDRPTANAIGRTTVRAMKDEIARGRSPIQGKPSFPSYKNPAKYPGNKKSSNPVNLKLTGDFLDSLIHKVAKIGENFAIFVGYLDSKKSQDIEEGHRNGANRQPKRPTIPTGSENLKTSIVRKITKIYDERIANKAKKL